MVTDQEIASCVESLLRQSDPPGGWAAASVNVNGVVQQLEAQLSVDLSHKAGFIRDQISLLLRGPSPAAPAHFALHHRHQQQQQQQQFLAGHSHQLLRHHQLPQSPFAQLPQQHGLTFRCAAPAATMQPHPLLQQQQVQQPKPTEMGVPEASIAGEGIPQDGVANDTIPEDSSFAVGADFIIPTPNISPVENTGGVEQSSKIVPSEGEDKEDGVLIMNSHTIEHGAWGEEASGIAEVAFGATEGASGGAEDVVVAPEEASEMAEGPFGATEGASEGAKEAVVASEEASKMAEEAPGVASSAYIFPMEIDGFPPHGVEWPAGLQLAATANMLGVMSHLLAALEEFFTRDPLPSIEEARIFIEYNTRGWHMYGFPQDMWMAKMNSLWDEFGRQHLSEMLKRQFVEKLQTIEVNIEKLQASRDNMQSRAEITSARVHELQQELDAINGQIMEVDQEILEKKARAADLKKNIAGH